MKKSVQKRKELPQFHVLIIHNKQTVAKMTEALLHITPHLKLLDAQAIANLAQKSGEAIITTTHKEKAELLQQLFKFHSPPIETKLIPA